jgi:glutathione S-transferase
MENASLSWEIQTMIRFWRAPWSTNAERVALALAYKELEVESVVISYDDRSPVEAISGQGLVPVIEDDGIVIADSRRILGFLEEKYPSPPLFPPRGTSARAELRLFMDWFDQVWKVAPNAIEAELLATEPRPERISSLGTTMRGHLEWFELLLADRDHLLSDDFSAADCVAFPFLKYARERAPGDDELFHRILDEQQRSSRPPRLLAWIERVDERPRAYG